MGAKNSVKLNLGAGLDYHPEWINYDRSRVVWVAHNRFARAVVAAAGRLGLATKRDMLDWPQSTRPADLTKGIPHGDATVDAIYTSHLLEHVSRSQAGYILRECHRVLKPGSTLRVVVPDLRLIAERYLAGDRGFFGGHEGPLADAFIEMLYLRSHPKGNMLERLARRALRTDEGGHQWMYDGESMSRLIVAAGFHDVFVRRFREGNNTDVALLDTRPENSVHIEAVK